MCLRGCLGLSLKGGSRWKIIVSMFCPVCMVECPDRSDRGRTSTNYRKTEKNAGWVSKWRVEVKTSEHHGTCPKAQSNRMSKEGFRVKKRKSEKKKTNIKSGVGVCLWIQTSSRFQGLKAVHLTPLLKPSGTTSKKVC